MKYLKLLLLTLLIIACGSSKKVIDNSQKTISKKQETEINKEIPYEIKEDLAVKDLKWNKFPKDTIIHITKDETNENKTKKNDTLRFHQEIKKRSFSGKDEFWTSLLQEHVADNGNVNYKTFKKNYKGLLFYIKILQENTPKDNATDEEKLAYWINAYNALTIDLILRNYPIKSIKDIDKPWDQRLWKFGDRWLNLNDIEHKILRKMDEPRIHFAIVCASYSCPKLQNTAFTAQDLDRQLTNATKEFLTDSERNRITEDNLELSKIFKWFAKDFKTEGSLIDFLNKYTEVEILPNAKKSFKDYNWDLND